VATTYGRGRIGLFTFDLAASTVLFHQGRREQSSIGFAPDYDGDAMYKPNDLFVGFLDERLADVPQADLHQDILVRLINWLTSADRPLPRLWYYPHAARAVAFFSGDGDAMAAADLRNVIEQTDRFGVPFTTYLMLDNYPVLEPIWEDELRRRGHGFGQHAWAGPRPTLAEMRGQLRQEFDAFEERYHHRPVSYRGHSVVWAGWTETAQYLAENGVRLDTNFVAARYYQRGYLNGSGLPVKFMDEDGRVIDVYEQCTISTDDGWLSDKCFLPAYSIEECIAASRQQLIDAVQKYHTVFHPYFHPLATNPRQVHTQPWLTAMLGYCRALNVPCVSDESWLSFNDARRAMQLQSLAFDVARGCLEFTLQATHAIAGVTLVFPYRHRGCLLAHASIDGEVAPCPVHQLEGLAQGGLIADFAAGQLRRFMVFWNERSDG
jgi:hypothetical protein